MIIAIDFDGTLVKHEYPEIGEPLCFAFKALKILKDRGHKLVLWTCREGELLQEAVDFCRSNGVEFDAVNDNIQGIGFNPKPKIYADLYIDDRAYMCGVPIKWHRILYDILQHG